MNKEEFAKFLEETSQEVDSWSEWKRKILGMEKMSDRAEMLPNDSQHHKTKDLFAVMGREGFAGHYYSLGSKVISAFETIQEARDFKKKIEEMNSIQARWMDLRIVRWEIVE